MIGVVIGRFQVDRLHDAHRSLIDSALGECEEVLVLLGCAPSPANARNPLSYRLRAAMLRHEYPQVFALPVTDRRSDHEWSKQVDSLIATAFPGQQARLYGGRDSCLTRYHGRWKTQVVEQESQQSATDRRAEIAAAPVDSRDFRAGVIHALQNLQPRVYMCTDVATIKEARDGGGSVALIRKQGEKRWRFPGGHVDLGECLELAARRELREETGQVVEHRLHYVGSWKLDDWRDAGHSDVCHTTVLYATRAMTGALKAGDDAAEAGWFRLPARGAGDTGEANIMEEHRALWRRLVDWLKDNRL